MKHDLGWEALADRRQLSRVILFKIQNTNQFIVNHVGWIGIHITQYNTMQAS